MSAPDSRQPCSPWDEQIEAFVDGDLDDDREVMLRAHLVGCARCRGEVDLASRLQRELRALPLVEMTPTPNPGPQEKPSPAAGLRPRRWLPWAAAAAAASLLLLVNVERPPTSPTAVEVAQAEHEARLALAYIGRAGRKTGLELRDEVLQERVLAPVREGWRRALAAPTAEGES